MAYDSEKILKSIKNFQSKVESYNEQKEKEKEKSEIEIKIEFEKIMKEFSRRLDNFDFRGVLGAKIIPVMTLSKEADPFAYNNIYYQTIHRGMQKEMYINIDLFTKLEKMVYDELRKFRLGDNIKILEASEYLLMDNQCIYEDDGRTKIDIKVPEFLYPKIGFSFLCVSFSDFLGG